LRYIAIYSAKATFDPVTIQDIYELFKTSQAEFDRRAAEADRLIQDVDRYAYRKGLFVIRQCGDSVELANDERFQPRAW
jgi:hypothetical protein